MFRGRYDGSGSSTPVSAHDVISEVVEGMQQQQQQLNTPRLSISPPPTFSQEDNNNNAPHEPPVIHHHTPVTQIRSLMNLKDSNVVERFFHVNAGLVASQLKHNYEKVYKGLRKPCVLLAGTTGSGKSSVVNAVFGNALAEVGVGRPLTQFFAKFELENKPITLFDAKGLEAGEDVEHILEENREFLEKHKPKSDNPIDVVWYVINCACARFQPFEAMLLKDLFKDFPVIILLNKADISTEVDRKSVRKCIDELKLKNLHAIVDTTADISHAPIPNDLTCPRCGSDEVSIKKRMRLMDCDRCHYHGKVPLQCGLEKVIIETENILTEQCAHSFIAAQRFSYDLKDKRSREIIFKHVERLTSCHLTTSLLEVVSEMISELSILWDFSYHGTVCAHQVAENLWGSISLADRLALLLSSCTGLYHEVAALGIMWSRAVRSLTTELVNEAVVEKNSSVDVNAALEKAFEQFTEEYMQKIVSDIQLVGLTSVLEGEQFQYKVEIAK